MDRQDGASARGYLTAAHAAAVPSQLESTHGIFTAPSDVPTLTHFLQRGGGSVAVSGLGAGLRGTSRLLVRPPTFGQPVGLFRSAYSLSARSPYAIEAFFLNPDDAMTVGSVSLWPGEPNWYEQVVEPGGFYTRWIHTFVTEIALDGLP